MGGGMLVSDSFCVGLKYVWVGWELVCVSVVVCEGGSGCRVLGITTTTFEHPEV